MNDFIIIVPYVKEQEIETLNRSLDYKIPVDFWKDEHKIGSDLAYQTLWNKHSDKDIIIIHADMCPMPEDKNNTWLTELLGYVNQFPEAGMFGTTLMYPAKNEDGDYYIQHAGGRFVNGEAIHIGGGLDLYSRKAHRELETDFIGKFQGKVREVSWVTFGGVYIRRSLLNDCGNFDPAFHWTYYRDVDYCLYARSRGWKIYQTPVRLIHWEGKDNKIIQQQDPVKAKKASINYEIFLNKWKDSEWFKTVDRVVYNEKEKTNKNRDTKEEEET